MTFVLVYVEPLCLMVFVARGGVATRGAAAGAGAPPAFFAARAADARAFNVFLYRPSATQLRSVIFTARVRTYAFRATAVLSVFMCALALFRAERVGGVATRGAGAGAGAAVALVKSRYFAPDGPTT